MSKNFQPVKTTVVCSASLIILGIWEQIAVAQKTNRNTRAQTAIAVALQNEPAVIEEINGLPPFTEGIVFARAANLCVSDPISSNI